MISDIIKLYRIGRELGLSKKDLNKILLFDNTKRSKENTLLLFLVLLGLIIGIVIVFTLLSYVDKNTYPQGARYSTVKIKDFKKGRKK